MECDGIAMLCSMSHSIAPAHVLIYVSWLCNLKMLAAPLDHIVTAALAPFAEVISAVGFDQELAALQVETGPNGKPCLPDKPFLQVSCLLCVCMSVAAI